MTRKVKTEVRKSKISGMGLFALEYIPWGTRIAEYTGEIINEKEYRRRTKFYDSIDVNYLFDLAPNKIIDGLVGGNETRFINHSDKPNCAVMRENGKIYFYSYKDIDKGEELTFHYGDNFIFKNKV